MTNIISCPKCQSEMKGLGFGGVYFKYCPNCQGYFVRVDELRKQGIDKVDHGDPGHKQDGFLENKEIYCLQCNAKMEKTKREKRQFFLDVCPECGSVWFDKNELLNTPKTAKI